MSTTETQLTFDFLHELIRAAAKFNYDCAFRRLWFFQISELTSQQRRIHEVTMPAA